MDLPADIGQLAQLAADLDEEGRAALFAQALPAMTAALRAGVREGLPPELRPAADNPLLDEAYAHMGRALATAVLECLASLATKPEA